MFSKLCLLCKVFAAGEAKLLTAAQDALSRGFAILACQPNSKDPLAYWNGKSYFPHAVNSATRTPEIALRPWHEGIPANYGVACGQSDIAVVDADHGLKSVEELKTWMKENNLPDTFVVVSGREGFGAHLYYTGAVASTSFSIGGVTGEVKSNGGYVVGAGSIHPSGNRYVAYNDTPLVPLPELFKQPSKPKPQSSLVGEQLVAAGNRNSELISLAGSLRNVRGGILDEETIYTALVNFATNHCEDGKNYAAKEDEKLRKMAHDAVTKFDAAQTQSASKCSRMSHAELLEESKANAHLEETVEGLIVRKTVNIAIGDSGLGKTPLFLQMALCIAFGIPFLGQAVQRGRVLIADYENFTSITDTLNDLAEFLQIPTPIDSEWLAVLRNPEQKDVAREIEDFKPSFVLVDALRGFEPKADTAPDVASKLIAVCQDLSQKHDCSWEIIHHVRKQDRNTAPEKRPYLFDDSPVMQWLEEAAGTRALVNQTHSRIGLAKPKTGESDLGIRGFVKSRGEVGPWLLERVYNTNGGPIGYSRISGSDLLNHDDRALLNMLPIGEPMSFGKVHERLAKSQRKTTTLFLKRCEDAKVIVASGKKCSSNRTYTRVNEVAVKDKDQGGINAIH